MKKSKPQPLNPVLGVPYVIYECVEEVAEGFTNVFLQVFIDAPWKLFLSFEDSFLEVVSELFHNTEYNELKDRNKEQLKISVKMERFKHKTSQSTLNKLSNFTMAAGLGFLYHYTQNPSLNLMNEVGQKNALLIAIVMICFGWALFVHEQSKRIEAKIIAIYDKMMTL